MLNTKIIQALEQNLSCNLARLKCLSLLISAVLRHRTVNLAVLATTNDGKSTSNESRYRRFQDFFLKFSLCLPSISKFVLSRVPKPSRGFVLAMDRTNWQFGCKDINFLVISIIVGKVSIPLVWNVLPAKTKRGNSNTSQRISLTKKLLSALPAKDIYVLTLDREFIGKQWLDWLNDQGVGYIVRIRKNTKVGDSKALDLATQRGRKRQKRQLIFGLERFFASKRVTRNARSSHLIIVSNRFEGKEALALYRLRWGIERLFVHLKKKGFDLEATHITDPAKLEKLFGILTLAFLFSFAWGAHLRATKQKDSAAAKRKSLFRLGLESIINLTEASPQSPQNRRNEVVPVVLRVIS